MTHLPLLIPLPLLVAAILVPVAALRARWLAHPVALAGVAASAAVSLYGLVTVVTDGPVRYHLGGWAPPLGIEYVLDPLSAFMATVITVVGLLVLVHALRSVRQETPEREPEFYAMALLLLLGLTGIVVSGDIFNVYVFLEIASLSAYALMAVGNARAPVAAYRYLILGTIAGSFYLLGVGFIYFSTGTLNMADVARLVPELYDSRALQAAALFIVLGVGLKMALFPLHVWLPDAYTYATSTATGLIAPVMTKVAAYILVRFLLLVLQPEFLHERTHLTDVVGWLAVGGVLAGSGMAIAQSNLKRMLAYSSIGQIAYVALGVGLANPLGIVGALLHIMNHAVMKACLFLVAGNISYRTGLTQVPQFGGLARRMPWTAGMFALAALSMIGIPPLAGFFSKWYLVLGGVEAGNWVFVAAVLASSLLTAAYFFRVLEKLYLTPPGPEVQAAAHREAPLSMLAPVALLAVGTVALGLANAYIVTHILELAVDPLR